MGDVFICDAVRTPIGRFGGSLAKVRADDLAAAPIKALMARHPKLDWSQVDEVYFGCANQAGEDNRNVARMALLLAVEEGPRTGGWATGILGAVAEQGLHDLDDAWIVATDETPIPYSPTLEDAYIPDAAAIAATVRARLAAPAAVS